MLVDELSENFLMARSKSIAPLVEISAMTALLLSFIWLWSGSFNGDFLFLLVLYFGLGIWSHIRSGENARIIGIRIDNLWPALLNALRVTIPMCAAALISGGIVGSFHYPSFSSSLGSISWGWIWGTAQQYGLLCFFYRRLIELLPSRKRAMIVAGTFFALFHLPNPFLVPVTFLAGTLSCWLYDREPNLFVLGAMHSIISFVIAKSLPATLTNNMIVGP